MTARKILLPRLPDQIVELVRQGAELEQGLVQRSEVYKWASAPEGVQEWCKQNICPDMYWGIQIISGNLPMHKDIGTQVKFNYIIDAAGAAVVTNFYDDEKNLIDTVHFQEHEWYILDVSTYHEVVGVDAGTRLSLTGRIFPTTRI